MTSPIKLSKRALIKALFFFAASLTCSTKTMFLSLVQTLMERLAPPKRMPRKPTAKLEL
ncbi:MAG: hypothetical protein P4M13_01400 [Alphaproteobacteria bacterium]|nr:hypothetical protein [Alphaproteobacteria bacterium]